MCLNTDNKDDPVTDDDQSTRMPTTEIVAGFCEAQRLTPRESQILQMICRGMKNAHIGRQLSVSDATVRLHMSNLHRKLGTGSKVDLVLKLWQWSLAGRCG